MVAKAFNKVFRSLFGSRNERLVKGYAQRVERINALESDARQLTDAELRAKTSEFRERLTSKGERIMDVMPEIFSIAREAMDRSVGIRNIFNPEFNFDASKLPADVRAKYDSIKARADAIEPIEVPGSQDGQTIPGWMQVEIPNVIYEAVRELYPKSRPPFRARPFDVQLIGGMVLGEGKIAEMKTGEGKTIVGPLACYVACCESLQCHVVTVNDYLVQRDRDWVFPFYYWLGLSVGAIHPFHMQHPAKKKEAYDCDVVYGTNAEFGFDYLRDNMKLSVAEQVQRRRDFCIIDEVDSILIDEARTPLIISGPAHQDSPRYGVADGIAKHLVQMQREWDAANQKFLNCEMRIKGLEGDIRNARDKARQTQMREEMKKLEAELPKLEAERDRYTQYYETEPERKAVHLTHDGVAEAQKQAGVGSFYVGNNMDFPHLLENSLRAHVIYKRDKDYVVRDGEVIIVDEFTGRLMIGRQWSDGLHQSVEAKEGVKIKEETQTLATVTIQNFAKLYERLAGMTGTAVTEATEFGEIYKREVVCIPTNVPVRRIDREDLIFLSEKDKWNAIVDEIKRVHDLGRPVLVGTTSVERSEMLSQRLAKRHGIKHEVLNAKVEQAEKEGNLVAHAGELGAVMIATNMAGRGTDIKLAKIEREQLINHWKLRNMLPAQAGAAMSDDEIINLSYRHQAAFALGKKAKELEGLSDEEVKLALFQQWCVQYAYVEEAKAKKMAMPQCVETLDAVSDFSRHRMKMYTSIEDLGGLYVIGTERHESRRIDNQLRGRSGRQGDKGSSRFFISLDDDLMKMFANKAMLTALSKLGMKEGDAIEHRWVTKSVERAQRKVEERNYEIRKNVLEYDEVMEHQRSEFYGIRQGVLEGRNTSGLILTFIEESITDACDTFLADDYVQTQIAEWCRSELDVSVDPARINLDDPEETERTVRKAARDEVTQVVGVTLGEYMSNDIPAEDWDLKGLSGWAMSRFSVDLKTNRLRSMSVDDVRSELVEAAQAQLEQKDLSGIAKFLEPHYAGKQLSQWCRDKFGLEFDAEELEKLQPDVAIDHINVKAQEAYHRREVTYPVQFEIDYCIQAIQQDPQYTLGHLLRWVNQRYQLGWEGQTVADKSFQELYDMLIVGAEQWMQGDKLRLQADEMAAKFRDDPEGLTAWMKERFALELSDEERETFYATGEGQPSLADHIFERGREALRQELTQLERFVLLQILDAAWKDHLHAMDQLKDSIGLRSYAEKDPRIEYKREGSRQFTEMRRLVRERVSELIFRAKLTPNVQLRSAYGDQQQAQHPQADSAVRQAARQSEAAQAASRGDAAQREDLAAAERAGSHDGDQHYASRKQRRAAEAHERKEAKRPEFKQRKRKGR